MKQTGWSILLRAVGALFVILGFLPLAQAEDVLFIGNSFTFGGGDTTVIKDGGVPKLVEAIAASKGKSASTLMVTTGGMDWGFHLKNPATAIALNRKPWDAVVIQDYSTKPTHVGNVDAFMKEGAEFEDRIVKASPHAWIVLYETWAYGAKNPIYARTSSPTKFTNPEQMTSEVQKNYAALQASLHAKNPDCQVLVAPVGDAFARTRAEHPEINLYATDFKHANQNGSYLAALVIYATLFHDSPLHATATFPGFTLDPQTAAKLQSVAQEITQTHPETH